MTVGQGGKSMQFTDHKLLSECLIKNIGCRELEEYHHWFVLGSMLPDANLFSYLEGVLKGYPFQMHFTANASARIQKMIRRLIGKKRFTWLDYYRMGVLTHYLADSFTFPHNEIFQGTMMEHAVYEGKILHPLLKCAVVQEISGVGTGRMDTERADIGRVDTERADIGRVDTKRADIGRVDTKRADIGRVDTERADVGRVDTKRADTKRMDIGRVDDPWELWKKAHGEYLRKEPSPQNDIYYIISICGQICGHLLPSKEPVMFENPLPDILLQ